MIQMKNQQLMEDLSNPEIAEILGAFIGDGWIENEEGAFYIAGSPIEDRLYYDDYLAPLFSKNFVEVKPRDFPYWKVYGITTYKTEVIKRMLFLGFQKGKKCLVAKIPSPIMECRDEEVLKAIARGIFDTDGSFWCERSRAITSTEWKRTHNYHPEMCIASCSKVLLLQVQDIFGRLGLESSVKDKHKAGFKYGRNFNNSYSLRIRKINEIENWFKIVGSSNPRHQTRFGVWKKWGYLPPHTTINQRFVILKINSS